MKESETQVNSEEKGEKVCDDLCFMVLGILS